MIANLIPQWLPSETDILLDLALARDIGTQINCSHKNQRKILHLRKHHDYPRATRFICTHCSQDVFIKRFGKDENVLPNERELRMHIEGENLQMLWHYDIFCEFYRGPAFLGYVGPPHFAVIQEFFNENELLYLLQNVAQNSSNDSGLYTAISAIARFLATMHKVPITLSDKIKLNGRHLGSEFGVFHNLLPKAQQFTGHINTLCSLNDEWIKDEFFQNEMTSSCLIHGGMTCVNLFLTKDYNLRVIDFESMCIGSRYIDIGTFTAELKVAFQLYGGNSLAAEPFISSFLNEYYSASKLNITYNEFTWLQAYFMGQRLVIMCVGRSFDDTMKRWLAQNAIDVWNHFSAR